MCGIAGFLGNVNWKNKIEMMNRRMLHRGPNAQEYWHDDEHEITFGHVRLSVLDLSEAGSQPMISHDDEHVLVFNGEIYNHRDLKERLISEKRCTSFRGHSDTETLLEYICQYGLQNALADSTGMFALALYDKITGKIYLARDRIGEKPLYYGFVKGKFCFGSDVGAIAAAYRKDLNIDRDALELYLSYGYIPAPYSIYREIKKLSPGAYATLSFPYTEDKISITPYWDIMDVAKRATTNPFKGGFADAVIQLEDLMRRSIERQMEADVSVGAFLSGGIDSSAVVSIMQNISPNSVETFTIGFEENNYDEAIYARKVANYLGTKHNEWYIEPKDALDIIPKLSYIYSEPFADSSQIATCLVSSLARKKVTVSLSGDGGDELFCGYNSYFALPKLYQTLSLVPQGLRKLSGELLKRAPLSNNARIEVAKKFLDSSSVEDLYMKASGDMTWAQKLLKTGETPAFAYNKYPSGFINESKEQNIMLMDAQMYLPDDILVKVDRAAMSVSLESRIPLLDKDIIEFAWSLPLALNKDNAVGKRVLRNLLYKYVPKEMMDRPKKGFSVPVSKWIRESILNEWANDTLNEDRIRVEGVLNPKTVSQTWKHFIKSGVGEEKIWRLLMFEEWMNIAKT